MRLVALVEGGELRHYLGLLPALLEDRNTSMDLGLAKLDLPRVIEWQGRRWHRHRQTARYSP